MKPVTFHFWPTPNCWKVAILLEELGLPYDVVPIDITRGDQFTDEFALVSPNNRVPAIVDHEPSFGGEPFAVFESGAILQYLAEKTGRFIPDDPRLRLTCFMWLFWQMGGLGPMAGQAHYFRLYAPEPIEPAIARYTNECRRLYGVLEHHLSGKSWIAGSYSIADIACLPWIFRHERHGQSLDDFPSVGAWYERLMSRPAVRAGFALDADLRDESAFVSAESHKTLFRSSPDE